MSRRWRYSATALAVVVIAVCLVQAFVAAHTATGGP